MIWLGDGGLTIVTTQIWTGSSWGTQKLTLVLAGFDLNNLSLKFVEIKLRAQSFLKEKEDEREKWGKSYFAQIRETKLVTRNCFVDKYKS